MKGDSAKKYESKIRECLSSDRLLEIWEQITKKEVSPEWGKGKLFEYLILRAFELEIEKQDKDKTINYVTYPYDVEYPANLESHQSLEQIDGAISIDGLNCLIECKNYTDESINVEPLAKLRNQLMRRHGNVFGMFFSTTAYTTPAQIQVMFMAPQIIILWRPEDIEYCIKNECMIECMHQKYKRAIEACDYDYIFSTKDKTREKCIALF